MYLKSVSKKCIVYLKSVVYNSVCYYIIECISECMKMYESVRKCVIAYDGVL